MTNMKKTIRIIIVTLAVVFIILIAISRIVFKDSLIGVVRDMVIKVPVSVIDYFELQESEDGKEKIYEDDQKVRLGDYTIKLEQVYNLKEDNKCYCRFSVRNKSIDMRKVKVREIPESAMGFGKTDQSLNEADVRFFFFVDADMKMGTIGEDGGFQQKKDVMYVYYMFELEGEGIKKVDYIYLYDKDAGKDGYTEFDSTPKCAAAKFKIK